MTKTLITITGASGSGKSTLEAMLCERFGYHKAVSFTTRQPRLGEQHGKDYYFIDKDYAQGIIDKGDAVESVMFGDDIYGLAAMELETDKPVVFVAEPGGAGQIAQYCEENGIVHIAVFLTNKQEVLLQRFMSRYEGVTISQEDVATIAKRIGIMVNDESTWLEKTTRKIGRAPDFMSRFGKMTQEGVLISIKDLVDNKSA